VLSVKKFLQKGGQTVKALLVIDNAPSHLSEEEVRSGDIIILFLPPANGLARKFKKKLLKY
jgi:hypothetical protein